MCLLLAQMDQCCFDLSTSPHIFFLDDKTTCISHTCPRLCHLTPDIRLSARFNIFWYTLLFNWDREEGSNKHCGVVRASCVPGGSLSASRTSLPYMCDGDSSHLAENLNIQKRTEETDWAAVLKLTHVHKSFEKQRRLLRHDLCSPQPMPYRATLSVKIWGILIKSGPASVCVAFFSIWLSVNPPPLRPTARLAQPSVWSMTRPERSTAATKADSQQHNSSSGKPSSVQVWVCNDWCVHATCISCIWMCVHGYELTEPRIMVRDTLRDLLPKWQRQSSVELTESCQLQFKDRASKGYKYLMITWKICFREKRALRSSRPVEL